ncbi:MAG: family 78 glycoside hydrolase catalytic domain [Ignavibacteriae bacterium]|nr:family 78 glycoside hydrolase catalytic domain [Ignavibacteriota bacterium]
MKNILVLLFIISVNIQAQSDNLLPKNLRCEYKVNPIGIDIEQPRLSWELFSEKRGTKQTSYQILVSKELTKLNEVEADIWNSGKIISDNSIQINYEGKKLESNQKYFWKIIVWDENNNSCQSEIAFWSTGLMKENEWKAKWIGLDKAFGIDNPNTPHRILSARMLRKEFSINKKVEKATAFISGLGLFELFLNGKKVGSDVFVPAATEYNKTSFYLTYDITKDLLNDQNAIGVILGNGRYFAMRSEIPTNMRTYGFPKLICQIEIEFNDGTKELIVSDESWKITTEEPIRKNNEYDGEYYDATMEIEDWDKANFDDSQWMSVELVEKPGDKLISQPNEPIRIMDVVNPISVKEIKPGIFIYDMGQNMVGWVELFVNGKKGDKVTLRFAETLKEDGSLFLDNIRSAEVTDTYILKGIGNENWEPKFTYHGFRFVEMIGYPGIPNLNSIKGKVIHDSLEITGIFNCSNELINKIYRNAFWGIRGNYRSMPTDCPQRDERHGWLGDRSSESFGESYIFNISNLYNKWECDIQDAQNEKGSIPDVAPSYWPFYNDNTTWAGTYLFIADMLYSQYGDLRAVQTHYPNMQKWIKHMNQYLKDGIMYKDTYGDWCVPPEDVKLIHTSDPLRTTSSEFIGTAFFNYELRLMAKFAKLLNKPDDEKLYLQQAKEIKLAFNNKFLDKNLIQYGNNSNTSNILAIAFDLVPEEFKSKIIDNLLQKTLGENEGHVGNGIIGGQWLMRTLTNNGHSDVAYLLASQTTYPSWGYMVKQGATTIWELWNGDHGDPGMNSGNHVMLLGDLIIWFYESLGGIKTDPLKSGFKHLIMKPQVIGDLTFVNSKYNSIRGEIISNWKLSENNFTWEVKIPANTTATVYVPTLNNEIVKESNKIAGKQEGVKFIGWEDNFAIYEIESGKFSFSSNGVKKKFTKKYTSNVNIYPRDSTVFLGDKISVTLFCKDSKAVIHYTIDGSTPNLDSPVYSQPFEIVENIEIKAQAFKDNYHPSMPAKAIYNFIDSNKNGIEWKLYKGEFKKIPNLDNMQPDASGFIYQFGLLNILDLPKYNFALRLISHIKIENDGEYEFHTSSNDGSNLYINDKLVVDNNGEHALKQGTGTIFLQKGFHKIRAEYFQTGGSKALQVMYNSKDIAFQPIPAGVLFRNSE